MSEYPEHEKLHAISDKSQIIGEFLEWLGNAYVGGTSIVLARYHPSYDEVLQPCPYNTEELLASFFEINLDKIEEEKQEMLDELRAKNGTKKQKGA